ncbi:MAG TPA: HAMP domain-containing sensor histidine kinase [Nitrososphaeraceae archaeon]
MLNNAESVVNVCSISSFLQSYVFNFEIQNSRRNAQSRGVKLRCITEINEDNIEQYKQLMSTAEVRHLPNINGILLVTEKEFFNDIDPLPFSSSSQLLYSYLEDVVKQHLDKFESLWNNAITVEERIQQIEEEKDQIATRLVETSTQFHEFMINNLKDTIKRDWYFQDEILRKIYENYFVKFKENMAKTLLLKKMNQNNKSKSSVNKNDIGLRCILKINRQNMEIVAKFLEIEGVHIRHTSNPLPINFEVSDKNFNLSMRTSEKIDTSYVLSIPDPSLIKYYKSTFEQLWNESLDAKIKINDIRSNLNREEGFTELIENPSKTQKLLISHVQKATEEILIILPSINAFFRYGKLDIFDIIEKKLFHNNYNTTNSYQKDSNKLLVKILTPANNKLEKDITDIYNRIKNTKKQKGNIEFRRIESLSAINTGCIIIDKKDLLVIELKDDSKDNFIEAVGSSIYSNTPTTVLSYISIFDTLWTQTELYESIRTANDELQSTTEELRESLQILANVNQELTVTNEILDKQDRMQKEFINVAAHELRTPTQSIVGYCEMIDAFPENTQKYLEPVKRNAEKLYRLTEDILDVSRIESGTLRLEKSKFDLREIILNLIEDLTAKMKKEDIVIKSNKEDRDKNTHIQLIYPELSAEPLFVYADKNRIQQVLSNLLGNALKFTDYGVITINTEKFIDIINNNENTKDQEFVSIKIKDTGKGIDPEVLPRLFEKFATKSDKGTGLGLYISKNIIDAHGGKIWGGDNKYKKNGAEFGFTLPLHNI